MTFGEKLKQLRLQHEYSQESLAELLHVSRQAVTKWENGNGMPDIENLKTISDVFGVTLDSLVRDVETIKTTDGSFCWKLAGAGFIIGLTFGWLFKEFSINMGNFGICGGIVGYVAGYCFLLVKQNLK